MTNVNCRLEDLVKTEKKCGSRSNKRHIEIELKFGKEPATRTRKVKRERTSTFVLMDLEDHFVVNVEA